MSPNFFVQEREWQQKKILSSSNMIENWFIWFPVVHQFKTIFTGFLLIDSLQMNSYKRYFEFTLVQWRLSIYPLCTQIAEGTFFMKSPVVRQFMIVCRFTPVFKLHWIIGLRQFVGSCWFMLCFNFVKNINVNIYLTRTSRSFKVSN